jgi:uncharacterized protein YhjY with autotransporter beta-barrel domain
MMKLLTTTFTIMLALVMGAAAADFTQPAGTSSTTTNAGDITGAPANLAAGDNITINGNITVSGSQGVLANNGNSTVTTGAASQLTVTNSDGIRVGGNSTVKHFGSIIVNSNGVGADFGITTSAANSTVNVFGSILMNGGLDGMNGNAGTDIFNLQGATIMINGGRRAISMGGGADQLTISNSTLMSNSANDLINTGAVADVATIRTSTLTAAPGQNAFQASGGNDRLTLDGFSNITGTVDGGGGGGDVLSFTNWRGFSQATANALIATGGNGTVTILGSTLVLANWETVTASNFQTFSSLITAPGLSGFSSALDSSVTGGATTTGFKNVFLALNSVPEADLNTFAQTASGQVYHNAFSSIAFNNASYTTGNLFGQLRHQGRNAAQGADLTAFNWNTRDLDPMLNNLDNNLLAMSNPGLVSVEAGSLQTATIAATAAANSAPYYEWQTFVIGSGSYAEQDAISGLAESEVVNTSAIIGVGKNLTEALNAGAYVGYQGVDAEVDTFGSEADGDGAQVGGYARYQWGDWLASGVVGYNYTAYENTRNVVSPAFTGVGESDADAHQIVSALELSRDFYFGEDRTIRLTPMAGVQYSLLHVEAFQESGLGGGSLSFNDQTAHSLRTKVGFELSKVVEGSWGWMAPYVSASWNHEFLDNSRDITTSFTDPALASFKVSTREADADFAIIGAGFNASLTEAENIHFSLGWQLQIGQEGYIANTATGGFRVDL